MATTVGLKFDMSASIGRFQKSMDRVERRLDSLDRSSRKAASGIGLLAKLQIGGALLKGVGMLSGAFRSATGSAQQFFNATLERVDALGKLSSSIGVAVEPLQILSKAASEAGVGQDKLGEAFKRMNKRIAEATMGFGEALPALQRLGLDADALSKMSPDQAFARIATAISELPTKGLQAATAFKIFSDQGLSLIPLFEDFPSKIAATTDRFRELGLGVNTVQTKNIEALNDTIGEVQSVMASIGAGVIANVAPTIKSFLDDILNAVADFEFAGSNGAKAVATLITDALFEGAILLGGWADSLLEGLKTIVRFFASLAEQAAKILGKVFKVDDPAEKPKSEAGRTAKAELEEFRRGGADGTGDTARSLQRERNRISDRRRKAFAAGEDTANIDEELNAVDARREKFIQRETQLRNKVLKAEQDFADKQLGIDGLGGVQSTIAKGASRFRSDLVRDRIKTAETNEDLDAANALLQTFKKPVLAGGITEDDLAIIRNEGRAKRADVALAEERKQFDKDSARIDAERKKREAAIPSFRDAIGLPKQFAQELPFQDAGNVGRDLAGFDLFSPEALRQGIAGRVDRQLQAGLAAGAAAENDPFAQRQAAIDKLRREGELAAENNKRSASAGLEIFKQTAERNIEQFRANPMAERIAASRGMSVDDFIDAKSSRDMEQFLANQRQQQERFVAPQTLEADRLQAQLDAEMKRAEQRAAVMRAREAAKAEAAGRPGAAAAGAAQPDDKVATKLTETNRLLAEANRKTTNNFVLATIS